MRSPSGTLHSSNGVQVKAYSNRTTEDCHTNNKNNKNNINNNINNINKAAQQKNVFETKRRKRKCQRTQLSNRATSGMPVNIICKHWRKQSCWRKLAARMLSTQSFSATQVVRTNVFRNTWMSTQISPKHIPLRHTCPTRMSALSDLLHDGIPPWSKYNAISVARPVSPNTDENASLPCHGH